MGSFLFPTRPQPELIAEHSIVTCDQASGAAILVVRFVGEYGYGSSGNQQARYMHDYLVEQLSLLKPKGLLIDCSGMAYELGDMLLHVYDAPGETPTAILVGDRCRSAMSTLYFGITSTRDIVEAPGFFADRALAMDWLGQSIIQTQATINPA